MKSGLATSDFGYTLDEICNNINTDEGKRYLFTFTSGNPCKAQNVFGNTNTYWGDNGQQRPAGTDSENDAFPISFEKNTNETFKIKANNVALYSASSASIFVAFKTNTTGGAIDFEVYKIEEIVETKPQPQATFNYYQKESGTLYASNVPKDVESTSTIAGLADVPTYLKPTYECGGSVVDGETLAEAGKTYTVRTSYPADFVIDGKTYFSLGSDISTALKATTGDIEFAKYAVKMSGNWIDGYLLQDKNGNYLSNTGSWDINVSDASKFDIEKKGDNWYLKSKADGKYLVINTEDGTASFNSSEKATPLKNLSDEQAKNYISTNCPVGHYVGSYSKDQAGKISFEQILNGEGKISISADKYYLFEEAADENFFLTSMASFQNMSDLTYTYKVSGADEVTFSSLWQWKINKIVNANTDKNLNWQASLIGETTASDRSAVVGYNEYKQAFTIQLGTNEGKTYYLKRWNAASIGSVNSKPANNDGYWFIREADAFSIPLNLNKDDGKTYATMYAPVKLLQDAEDNTIIYTGKMNENGSLHLEEWAGGVIPAKTPLVLVNEEGAKSAKFLISYETAAREVTPDDNWTGTNIKLQFSGNERENYRLFGYNSKYGVGFFKPQATGYIPANRGYIQNLPKQTIGLQFPDGTTTSIDAAIFNGNNTAEDTPIYDLSGRRIMQPTRGQFYIRGGQKFIAQ